MQYLLLIYGNEAEVQATSRDATTALIAEYARFKEAIQKAGAYIGSNRLRPTAAATTVQIRNGKPSVVDGPFAETKEQLGGYYLIDVPDLETARSWALRCPAAAHGTVEVRPVWTM
jgi:hypothetical protein